MSVIDLERAAALATRLLLSQRLYSTQIDVTALSYDKTIIFDSYTNFCYESRASITELTACGSLPDGCTIKRRNNGNDIYIILYNDKVRSSGRRGFTLAHEVGHVYLEHEDDGAAQETEANHFAAHLLLPPILVWELLKRSKFSISASELARIFASSRAAAESRLRTLETSPPVFSSDEALLLERFGGLLPHLDGPFIDC